MESTTLEKLTGIAATLSDAEQLALLRIAETMAIHPAIRATLTAPLDDEHVTEEDRLGSAEALADPQPSVPHEEILGEFGLL
jgi:hypothetical protein